MTKRKRGLGPAALIATVAVAVLAIVAIWAFVDAGREPVRELQVSVPLPEQAK